nr:hypothetical protein [uncultured Devosia sp.]
MQITKETSPRLKGSRGRKQRQRMRLQAKFKSLLASIPQLEVVGGDPYFQSLLDNLSKQPPSAIPVQVIAAGAPMTIVGVPERIWMKPEPMSVLLKAKHRMLEQHRNCILVPQDAIQSNPPAAVKLAELYRRHPDALANLGRTSCPSQHLHDPVGCAAHMMVAGKPCPQVLH